MEKNISVVIPVLNESLGIARVISIMKTSPLVGEVIVVDDGSSDNSADIALHEGAHVIKLPRNLGKGQAMDAGVRQAKNDTILFCDGDMYGFTHEGISAVVSPVLSGYCDMMIGVRPAIAPTSRLLPFLTQISGFRAIHKHCWNEIPEQFISGYHIELVINFVSKRNAWKTQHTEVPGLHHFVKEEKYGLIVGLRSRLMMIVDLVQFMLSLYVIKRQESNAALKKARRTMAPGALR